MTHNSFENFDKDYPEIKKLADYLSLGSNQTPEDIISDAYLGMIDEIGGYDLGVFKKHANISAREHQRGVATAFKYENKEANSADDYKVCYKCKKPHPRDSFGILNIYRHNTFRVNSYCKTCMVDHVKDWQTNNKKHRSEWLKKYRIFCSENLTDQYIIRRLDRQLPYYLIKKNKSLIELKREQIILERKLKSIIKTIRSNGI